jgi:hypothetical protein
MTKDEIMVCIGNYLERHEYVEASCIQKQIMYSSVDKKVIPIEEIEEILEFLVIAGFLEVYVANEHCPAIYIRFIPDMIKMKLRKL